MSWEDDAPTWLDNEFWPGAEKDDLIDMIDFADAGLQEDGVRSTYCDPD